MELLEILKAILVLAYIAVGYWAAGVVCFENKIVIHSFGGLLATKFMLGLLLGVILIPIAIIKRIIQHILT